MIRDLNTKESSENPVQGDEIEREESSLTLVRILIHTSNDKVCYVTTSIEKRIDVLYDLFDSRHLIFTYKGSILNPRSTFKSMKIPNNARIQVFGNDPGAVIEMDRDTKWNNLENLEFETRIKNVFRESLLTEMSKISDLRYARHFMKRKMNCKPRYEIQYTANETPLCTDYEKGTLGDMSKPLPICW